MRKDVDFGELIGKTIISIDTKDNDELIFNCNTGESYRMYHSQDCCEHVEIEDITGNLNDLLNSPILKASEDRNSDNPKEDGESHTWTFYNIATIKGHVTIRWYGESNGYYSESVDFEKIK